MRAFVLFLMACGATPEIPSPEVKQATPVAALVEKKAPAALAFETPAPWGHNLPADWTASAARGGMRLAQFSLPGATEADAGEVVVYFFNGGGGTVQANFERWAGQMRVKGQENPLDAATISKVERGGYTYNGFDLSGDYIAETNPGSGERVDEKSWRLIGTIIEGQGGPWFVKLTGPKATADAHAAAYQAWIDGLTIGGAI